MNKFLKEFANNLGLRVDLLASAMLRDAEGFSCNQENSVPFVYLGNNCIKSSISR